MLFSSSVFLFLFLPLFLVVYFLAPNKLKNLVLLLSSLFFYSWGENLLVLVMICSIVADYGAAIIIEKGFRKIGLFISLLTNLLLLSYFKYYNFFLDSINSILESFNLGMAYKSLEIALPLGISFYTFQSMSYTLDVYFGKVKANKNLIQFATYVTMFPQLVAGPIVRYIDIQKQLVNKRLSWDNFYSGAIRFILGLAKKMILANSCGYVADNIWAMEFSDYSTSVAWLGIIAYSLQIYFDFSGYSDMAIGLGRMLGFSFLENFNFPYIAKNIRDFWRRWHISLSTWFRDYLYIPLGGSREGAIRTYVNLVIVFFITGLWHGASWNFVVWGMIHGLFIVIERLGFDKILEKLWMPIQHFYTLFVVVIAWVFFRADNLSDAIAYNVRLFTISSGDYGLMEYVNFMFFNIEHKLIIILAVIFSMPVSRIIKDRLSSLGNKRIALESIGALSLFVLSVSYVVNDSYNPFIYFRF